ncbi:flagellar hook-length control protein FliK [Planococcus sp. S3-L1]|uniref:flagellar hook-length control protein FliK n=1 Tax=Planococcus sp. S3-L1 TaxID=3046200 RepID=UPI0024BB8DA4|nr:flagellar hook-length control protein FliK [Planococcus sp. S3-L1]MDJ0331388.1 flagellar hook-length control protein FliK [Planococcus sp. S3-L1]
MEALKPTFQQTISPVTKTTSKPVVNQAAFASLLESLALPPVSEQQAPTENLLENVESVLASLQELLVEEPTTEQQEIQYAILQLQQLQADNKPTGLPAPGQVAANASEDPSQLVSLLQKIQQQLQILVEQPAGETVKSPMLNEVEGKANKTSVNGLIQLSKQLDDLLGMLEKQQALIATSPQLKPVIASSEESRAVKDIPTLVGELLKPVSNSSKVSVEMQKALKELEAGEGKVVPKLQSGEELQTPKESIEVKATPDLAAQPLTMTADAGKVAGTLVKAEASLQPVPLVRLPHLLEDLGGMLKSSMRLVDGQEGLKMRVNIFPEHLGHLEILLTSTNGKLAAQIMASTPMAKEAIELQLNQLRTSLIQQGVEVEKIEVLEQSPQQPFNQQQPHAEQRFTQQQSKNSRSGHSYFQSEEDVVKETTKPLPEGLPKVDYTV